MLGSDGCCRRRRAGARRSRAASCPSRSSIPVYAELLADGARGLQFAPGDARRSPRTCAARDDPAARDACAPQAAPLRAQLSFARVADELEEIYRGSSRAATTGARTLAAARIVADRPLIDVDLHMHTDHSYDCATPVEVLLARRGRRASARSR